MRKLLISILFLIVIILTIIILNSKKDTKNQKKAKYHIVTITLESDCDLVCDGDVYCNERKYIVKDGSTLKEIFGFDAKYIDANKLQKIKTQKLNYNCIDVCCYTPEAPGVCQSCCMEDIRDNMLEVEYEYDYDTDTKIYEDLNLIHEVDCQDPYAKLWQKNNKDNK